MALKQFKTLNTKDELVNRIQDSVKEFADQFNGKQLLDGVLTRGILITTSGTGFNHSLNRQPIGWMLTDSNGAATVYRTAWDDKTVTLKASADITADVWVF